MFLLFSLHIFGAALVHLVKEGRSGETDPSKEVLSRSQIDTDMYHASFKGGRLVPEPV
jgi:hypothetical protein